MSDAGSGADVPQRSSSGDEVVLEGTPVASGIVIGEAFRYRVDSSPPDGMSTDISENEVEDEIAVLDDALQRAREEVQQVRAVAKEKLGPDGEAIFEAQEMMLRDDDFLEDVRRRIRTDGVSAAGAVSSVLDDHRQRLRHSSQEYLRERTTDLDELEGRLLRSLRRGKVEATMPPNSIVAADRLTTGDIVRLHRGGMLGCVTARGGRTSHVSIIARALNIPTLVGVEGVLDTVGEDDRVILDGDRGTFVVRPSDETVASYRRQRAQRRTRKRDDRDDSDAPVKTRDGQRIAVRANVEFREELDVLDEHGADGIGLLRTEMIFLEGGDGVPTEDRQAEVYGRAAEVAGDSGATVRLFDFGGEKFNALVEEENPSLGWRGVRILLDRTDELLRPQIRALLRANARGTLRVLIPMVTHLDEVRRIRTLIDTEADQLRKNGIQHDGDLPVGVMVETPAAALRSKSFVEVADFFSLGTNDLTQYVLAIDRANDFVADRYDELHPSVLELVRRTIRVGAETGTPVELCGEVGSDRAAIPILLGCGLEAVSVAPPYLSSVRQIIRSVDRTDAKRLAERAIEAGSAEEVRRLAREWVNENVHASPKNDRELTFEDENNEDR